MGQIRQAPPWQRPALAILGLVGFLDAGYLLVTRATGTPVACPAIGGFDCDSALRSPYALVLGVPLAVWGLAAYLAVMLLAGSPWLAGGRRDAGETAVDRATLWALRSLTAGMAATGAFLVYLMLNVLKGLCPYCLVSAGTSAALFLLSLAGPGWKAAGRPAVTGLVLGSVAIMAIASAPEGHKQVLEKDPEGMVLVPLQTYGDFLVTTTSGPAEMAFAKFLAAGGARMYGGHRCPHCHRMKQLFGKEAWALIRYVECDGQAPGAQPEACVEAGVHEFPTWAIPIVDEFGGNSFEKLEGEMDLQELATETHYQGAMNFQRRIRVEEGQEGPDPDGEATPPPDPNLDLNIDNRRPDPD